MLAVVRISIVVIVINKLASLKGQAKSSMLGRRVNVFLGDNFAIPALKQGKCLHPSYLGTQVKGGSILSPDFIIDDPEKANMKNHKR